MVLQTAYLTDWRQYLIILKILKIQPSLGAGVSAERNIKLKQKRLPKLAIHALNFSTIKRNLY